MRDSEMVRRTRRLQALLLVTLVVLWCAGGVGIWWVGSLTSSQQDAEQQADRYHRRGEDLQALLDATKARLRRLEREQTELGRSLRDTETKLETANRQKAEAGALLAWTDETLGPVGACLLAIETVSTFLDRMAGGEVFNPELLAEWVSMLNGKCNSIDRVALEQKREEVRRAHQSLQPES